MRTLAHTGQWCPILLPKPGSPRPLPTSCWYCCWAAWLLAGCAANRPPPACWHAAGMWRTSLASQSPSWVPTCATASASRWGRQTGERYACKEPSKRCRLRAQEQTAGSWHAACSMPSSQLCSCVSPPSALTLPARPARMQSTRYGTRIYTETVDKLELLKVRGWDSIDGYVAAGLGFARARPATTTCSLLACGCAAQQPESLTLAAAPTSCCPC